MEKVEPIYQDHKWFCPKHDGAEVLLYHDGYTYKCRSTHCGYEIPEWRINQLRELVS